MQNWILPSKFYRNLSSACTVCLRCAGVPGKDSTKRTLPVGQAERVLRRRITKNDVYRHNRADSLCAYIRKGTPFRLVLR